MPEETDRRDEQRRDEQPRSSNQQGGGQQKSQQQGGRPSARKGLFDATNVAGYVLWLVTAVMGSMVAVNIFVPVSPVCRDVDLMINSVCLKSEVLPSAYTLPVLIVSLVAQILITVMSRRVHDLAWKKGTTVLEVLINFIGFYWLACVQLGYMEGLRAFGRSVVTLLSHVETLGAIAVLIGLSILFYRLPAVFWDMPASGNAPQSQQRRK